MQISKRNGWQMNLHSFQLSIHSTVECIYADVDRKKKKIWIIRRQQFSGPSTSSISFSRSELKSMHISLSCGGCFVIEIKKSSEHTKKRAIYNLKQMCSLSGNRLSRRSLYSIMARRMFHCQRPKMAKKCWFSSSHYSLARMTKCNLNDRHFAIKKERERGFRRLRCKMRELVERDDN